MPLPKTKNKPKLKKSIGLFEATMYGVGIILGAGIYALLGEGAGLAGSAVWLSFIIASIIAAFTGLSYCELSGMFPKEAAEYVFTRKAFGKRPAFVIGWTLLISNTIGAATVALGFAGYFSGIFSAPIIPVAIVLIVGFSLLNYKGIKESSNFNIVATLIETGGLLLVIAVGALFFADPSLPVATTNFMFSPTGFYGVMTGAALIFFAYIGFQDLANISEETTNAIKVVPKALLLSLVISTILYVLVAVSAVSVVGWETLATSQQPLADVLNVAFGFNASLLMSVIALFSTGNTVLILLIVESRIMYGMAKNHSLPSKLAKIHKKHGTPYIAVLATMVIASLITLVGDISIVAKLTTIGIFISFAAVNAALIYLRYKKPRTKRPFKIPVNIGRFPLLAGIGLVSSLLMLAYFEPLVMLAEAAVIAAGIGIDLIWG